MRTGRSPVMEYIHDLRSWFKTRCCFCLTSGFKQCQLSQLRQQKKISQAKLARKIGTTQSNIARMESGQQNFTTYTLQKIAKALGCDLRIEFIR